MGVERVPTGQLDDRKPAVADTSPLDVPVGGRSADWRGDVALELWVETDVAPARVRLAGRLDATTAANLTQVILELLDDGTLDMELCTDGLRSIDASALGVLADAERAVRARGGRLVRVGPIATPLGRHRRSAAPPPH